MLVVVVIEIVGIKRHGRDGAEHIRIGIGWSILVVIHHMQHYFLFFVDNPMIISATAKIVRPSIQALPHKLVCCCTVE